MGLVSERDGMGIEIIRSDRNFIDFLNTLLPSGEKAQYKEIEGPAISRAGNMPASPPPSRPGPRPKSEPDLENDEIDSAISSVFSRRDKK